MDVVAVRALQSSKVRPTVEGITVLRGIAYDSSTKGKCADTKKSETTENCEAGNGGSTNVRTTAIIDGREKDKKSRLTM